MRAEDVLRNLTLIANNLTWLAVLWHVLAGAAVVAWFAGWRPPTVLVARLLIAPLVSVSAAAWASGNPFNGLIFLLLSAFLLRTSLRLSCERVTRGPAWQAGIGILLVAFAWVYPHFLEGRSWIAYAYAAPLGLLPCPTLALVTGVTLLCAPLADNRRWSITVAMAGLFYGLLGLLWLDVALDAALLAGALSMLVVPTRFLRYGRPMASHGGSVA